MARLDELLEVLTEELDDFKSCIKRMEAVSNKLNNSEIQRDISSTRYQQEQEEQGKAQGKSKKQKPTTSNRQKTTTELTSRPCTP